MSLVRGLALGAALLFGPGAFAGELVFGSLNDNVRKQIDRFTPLELCLEEALAGDGIDEVRLEVFQDEAALAEALKTGAVDVYYDSPMIAARVGQISGAEPFLRRWKRGVSSYHSVIVVPKDSEIKSLQDLQGKTIAMQEPTSTSGFLLPAVVMLGQGLELEALEQSRPPEDKAKVGYAFSGDDKNSLYWLTKGLVAASASDNRAFAQLERAYPEQYRVLARSLEVPRQVLMLRSGFDPVLKLRLQDVLTSLDQTDSGRSVLKKFHKTTKMDPFPEDAALTFATLRTALAMLAAAGIE